MSVYERYNTAKATLEDLLDMDPVRIPAYVATDPNTAQSMFKIAAVWYGNLNESSHDMDHAVTVFENAVAIVADEHGRANHGHGSTPSARIYMLDLRLAAILHDVRDHKAITNGANVCSEHEMIELIRGKVSRDIKSFNGAGTSDGAISVRVNAIRDAIGRSSWSKRADTAVWMASAFPRSVTLTRILQDADWLEAIGEIGISRCEEYTRSRDPTMTDDTLHAKVCEHIREKLLLIPQNLNFEWSRNRAAELSKPLHAYLEKFERR